MLLVSAVFANFCGDQTFKKIKGLAESHDMIFCLANPSFKLGDIVSCTYTFLHFAQIRHKEVK